MTAWTNVSAIPLDCTPPFNLALQNTVTFLSWFRDALRAKSGQAIVDLLHDDGWYRDLLICEWEMNSIPKSDLLGFFNQKGLPNVKPASVELDATKSAPAFAKDWITAYFVFETPVGTGEGVLCLMKDSFGIYKAFTLALTLSSLTEAPQKVGPERPLGCEPDPLGLGRTWSERRADEIEFAHEDPTVVIVGAGQAGLIMAARLKRLRVPTLVIDKEERLGDTWRARYRSLTLHDPVYAHTFPYLDYPNNWPLYTPKDKMAEWHETYARALDLNVWMGTTLLPEGAVYDDESETWSISLLRGDGSVREISCRHVIQATGLAGFPRVPKFDAVEKFCGPVIHSTQYKNPQDWAGKNAVIVGAANSAHDIAQELCQAGAHTTMVQRSPALLFTRDKGNAIFFNPAYWHNAPPTEESDLYNAAFPRKQLLPFATATWKRMNEADKELLYSLDKAGFKLEPPGGPGPLFRHYQRAGGFCVETGSAALIIDGKINMKHGEIARFESDGLRLKDGSFVPADIVILATGFGTMREACQKIFGDNVVSRTGPVWGLDEQFEPAGIWRHSGHPGFWFAGSNVMTARIFSKYLALQIKAIELGLAPKNRPGNWKS